jgi:outer membrane protein
MRRLGLLSLLLVVVLCIPWSMAGAQQKIGFVNATVIFEQYSAAREAEESYQKELEELNKQVTAMEEELRALADTLEARKYLFSEERLKEKRAELDRKQQEYIQFRQDAEMRAAKRNDELSRPIVEAIEEAAKTVAEKDGYDLVLDSGPGIVVYSKPELDLTDRVLQALEEGKSTGQ